MQCQLPQGSCTIWLAATITCNGNGHMQQRRLHAVATVTCNGDGHMQWQRSHAMAVVTCNVADLGILQGSADALPVLQKLAHLWQEPAPQCHQLLNLLLTQMQCLLQQHRCHAVNDGREHSCNMLNSKSAANSETLHPATAVYDVLGQDQSLCC